MLQGYDEDGIEWMHEVRLSGLELEWLEEIGGGGGEEGVDGRDEEGVKKGRKRVWMDISGGKKRKRRQRR